MIVPRLTSKINDTNEDIKNAAINSLSLILSTIKNPEISQIRDIIIKSLSDPFNQNKRSLEAILNIKFNHFIDGPSLSLIMPIIVYGLKYSQNAEPKENAAKIVANIVNLIQEEQDLYPHIETLIEALQSALKDISPEVRSLTSKALKSLTLKYPKLANFVLNKLKKTLMEPTTISIEKAGNSQAFAEILGILDIQILDNIFNDMLNLTMDNRVHVRESFLSVFVYLPIVFD